jgi:phage tail-like protein
MAQAGKRNDPFPAFRFEITFKDLPVGGFSEVTGLTWELDPQEYQEGGENRFVRRFPNRAKQTNLTLKRGIVDRLMWDWFYDITQGRVKYRDGSILVRDPSGENVVMQWDFKDAFPTKWVGPDLNASQNSVAVETLELAHHGLERIT